MAFKEQEERERGFLFRSHPLLLIYPRHLNELSEEEDDGDDEEERSEAANDLCVCGC